MVCLALSLAACEQPSPQSAAITAPLVPPLPSSLMGSTPAVLNAEFGAPVLRRVDGTAQVWLYHSEVCGLNLILYPDSSGTPRVAAAVPDNGDAASCMASLQRGVTAAALERGSAS